MSELPEADLCIDEQDAAASAIKAIENLTEILFTKNDLEAK